MRPLVVMDMVRLCFRLSSALELARITSSSGSAGGETGGVDPSMNRSKNLHLRFLSAVVQRQ